MRFDEGAALASFAADRRALANRFF